MTSRTIKHGSKYTIQVKRNGYWRPFIVHGAMLLVDNPYHCDNIGLKLNPFHRGIVSKGVVV